MQKRCLSQVVAAVEELTVSINHVADRANETLSLANRLASWRATARG